MNIYFLLYYCCAKDGGPDHGLRLITREHARTDFIHYLRKYLPCGFHAKITIACHHVIIKAQRSPSLLDADHQNFQTTCVFLVFAKHNILWIHN